MQIAFPITDKFDIEQTLFEHRLYDEIAVPADIKLPDTLDGFHKNYSKKYSSIAYRTDVAGFEFMRVLAHKYYETDLFQIFWEGRIVLISHSGIPPSVKNKQMRYLN